MERKIHSIDFDKEQIDAETRTNLSSDLFDSKQREIDLAIKKQKLIFLSIKTLSLCLWSCIVLDYRHFVSMLSKPLFKTL